MPKKSEKVAKRRLKEAVLYEQGLSTHQIARKLGVTAEIVRKDLEQLGVARRQRHAREEG